MPIQANRIRNLTPHPVTLQIREQYFTIEPFGGDKLRIDKSPIEAGFIPVNNYGLIPVLHWRPATQDAICRLNIEIVKHLYGSTDLLLVSMMLLEYVHDYYWDKVAAPDTSRNGCTRDPITGGVIHVSRLVMRG